MNSQHKIKAFFIAPLAAPVLYLLGVLILSDGNTSDVKSLLWLASVIFLFSAPVSYISTAIFGLPLLYYLDKNNLLNIYSLSFSGAALGGVLFVFLLGLISGFEVSFSISEYIMFLLAGGGMGLGVALLFAYIVGLTSA